MPLLVQQRQRTARGDLKASSVATRGHGEAMHGQAVRLQCASAWLLSALDACWHHRFGASAIGGASLLVATLTLSLRSLSAMRVPTTSQQQQTT